MNTPIRVTIYNEFFHEQHSERIRSIYPKGIHGAIGEKLSALGNYQITYATLNMPEHGLSKEVLDQTDVLIWWGHCQHDAVSDEVAFRVKITCWTVWDLFRCTLHIFVNRSNY